MHRPLSIAHRGASGHEPENTMAAFEKALSMGCGGIELDVMLSADGVPVVFHDESAKRLTGIDRLITDLKISEARALKVMRNHKIPLLDEVIELVSGRCLLNIEIKSPGAGPTVAKSIKKSIGMKRFGSDIIVSSFDWNVLKYLSEDHPEINLGVLTMTDLDLALDFAKFIGAHAIHPHYHLLTLENCKQIRQLGFKNYCWTVNDLSDIGTIKNYGVDGIITDYPERV